MATPAQLTLAYMRKQGYTCAITERWNAFAKVRQDLFGGIDVLAIKAGVPIVGIQCTTKHNMMERIKKLAALPQISIWLQTGGLLFVYGWYQESPKSRWKVEIAELLFNQKDNHTYYQHTSDETEESQLPIRLEQGPKAVSGLDGSGTINGSAPSTANGVGGGTNDSSTTVPGIADNPNLP